MSARKARVTEAGKPQCRTALWLGLCIVIVCAIYASQLRLAQLAAWNADPAQYVAAGVPMMTTLDAYYSLRIARRYASGTFIAHGPVPERHYARPEQADPNEWYDQREPKQLPLLSVALVGLSKLFDGNIDRAGLVLSPLFSSVFMIPLFLCCWRLGAPGAGLMGGLVATFCIEYYQRTSVGWVETDALNLFFPWTVTLLFLGINGTQSQTKSLLHAAAAGAVMYAFFRWYPKPGLTVVFIAALTVHLLLARMAWRPALLCIATFAICANPAQLGAALGSLQDFVGRYLSTGSRTPIVASTIRFPEVWSTISEVRRLGLTESLERIVPHASLAIAGLAGFVLLALRHWRKMGALAPVMALAFLAFVSSRRFIFYLAPFVGIGWGHIVWLVATALLDRVGHPAVPTAAAAGARHSMRAVLRTPVVRTAVSYLAIVVVFGVWFVPTASRAFVPRPAVPAPVFRDLQQLADRLPVHSRVWTWWDLGFAIVDTAGFGVYHDGSAQYTPQTNVIAASFIEPSQRLLYDLIGFVDREGNRGIRQLAAEATNGDDLLNRMRKAPIAPADVPIYVLFTPDMMLAFPSIRYLGTFGAAAPASIGVRWLQCARLVDDVLQCAGEAFDLRTGAITSVSASAGRRAADLRLRRAVIAERGRPPRMREYMDAEGTSLEIVVEEGAVRAVYLLDEPAYESNLNQMFFLGRFDPAYFELAFDDFPYARAFRVRTARD